MTYRRLFSSKDTQRLKVKGWLIILQINGNQRKLSIAILISDKIDFKSKSLTRDKDGHCIMVKRSVYQEDTMVNIYAPNMQAPELKGEVNNNAIIIGDFCVPPSAVFRSSKFNNETLELNHTLKQWTYTGHSIQQQQNTHSPQVHKEHSSG